MTPTSIALHRFGLGARPDDRIGDPQDWLAGQLGRYVVHPPALAGMASTREGAAVIAQFKDGQDEQRRAKRRQKREARREGAGGGKQAGKQGDAPSASMQFRRRYGREAGDLYEAAAGARLNAALVTDTPFAERLVHFWANHFSIGGRMASMRALAGGYERDAIRPHIMGSFRKLLGAAEQHPAMLMYLNQVKSIGPNSPVGRSSAAARKKNGGMNENYAREVLELHTLGVRGGYTQADVGEFARAVTGWTAPELITGSMAGEPGTFGFDPEGHEPGARTVLGRTYPEGGREQGEAILDDLARHPATARHIATKLTRHFAGTPEPVAMVDRLATAFTRSAGDLPTVYRALIASPEAWTERPLRFRTPWEWTIAVLRATGTRQVAHLTAQELLKQLGQPTWRARQPSGWDDDDASWAAADAVMRRVEAAERLAAARTEPIAPRQLADALFPGGLSRTTAQALERAESPAQGLALLFVSPEMMRR